VLGPGMMWNDARVVVQDLATGVRTTIAERATYGRYLAGGQVVYATSDGTIEAVEFDLDGMRVTSEPVVVGDGVRVAYWGGAADFAVADNGTLAYVRGSTWEMHYLVEADRSGRIIRRIGSPATFEILSLAPDDRFAVAYVASNNSDIYRIDLQTGDRRRLTFDETTEDNPVYSRVGSRVAYHRLVSGRDHRIYALDVDDGGEPTLLYQSEDDIAPRTWSPDGKTLGVVKWPEVFFLVNVESGTVDTVTTQGNSTGGKFSPDGRWLAFVSEETGRPEVYVVSVPELRSRRQVSTQGGDVPRWAARSNELFFLQGDTVMVSAVSTGATFTNTIPRPVFVTGGTSAGFVVTADGQRFIYAAPNPDAAASEIHVVLNWTAEVEARLAQRR